MSSDAKPVDFRVEVMNTQPRRFGSQHTERAIAQFLRESSHLTPLQMSSATSVATDMKSTSNTCCFCTKETSKEQETIQLPRCGHTVHLQCIECGHPPSPPPPAAAKSQLGEWMALVIRPPPSVDDTVVEAMQQRIKEFEAMATPRIPYKAMSTVHTIYPAPLPIGSSATGAASATAAARTT